MRLLLLNAIVVALSATTCCAQTTAASPAKPDFSGFSKSVTIPFSEGSSYKRLLHVRAQINGGPVHGFTVDTGSVGIVVGADDVPNIDPNAPEATFTYSSSGVQLHGVWTTATVTFPDAEGGEAVAVVPVLAVRSETCTGSGVNSEHCKPSDHPQPHMMGIGFGRGLNEGHPEKNPFLNLKEMQAGTMRRGYVISRAAFTLGLTPALARPDFVWQKLKPKPVAEETKAVSPTLRDWETAPGSFSIEKVKSGMGAVLIDTGLTNMMVAVPDAPGKGDVPNGATVTVELLGGQLHYSFVVGDENNPETPRKVSWVRPTHGVYVNTGLRALSNFDYLFDSDGGWLAMRPVKP